MGVSFVDIYIYRSSKEELARVEFDFVFCLSFDLLDTGPGACRLQVIFTGLSNTAVGVHKGEYCVSWCFSVSDKKCISRKTEDGVMSPGVSVSGDYCRNIHLHSQIVDMERWHSDSPCVDRVE